ncbi:hypothetical protein DTO271D3_5883 [Paecilomyces variotii]|nr:hypothetical protein DTO169C6_4143 [Paecilomyces variotii]KAJ9246084.1 hypothetical protein DTO169E5_208 [Paecilomyces variotii]KAJ9259102.1 hypothetical protein DTO207G8_1262 [Paecilomyces variotii]KAJ9269036.1 hypothetical protein DTO212C5_4875 [Paecilomyces variotii]KAJ9313789.1 hypothetical protein DTO271D3_5883 [Paecilomyces variotii]
MSPPAPLDIDVKADSDTTTVVVPDPLTVTGIAAWRLQAAKVPTGTAAAASSDMFKSPGCYKKPKAKKWDHLLSEEAKLKQPSTLKGAAKYLKKPGMISLGGGLPSAEHFPIEHIEIKVPTPPHFSEEETQTTGSIAHAGKHDVREGKSVYDLEVALNYGQAIGSGPMLRFVTEHTEIVHNPPYADWQCCMTAGSTASWDAALRIFCEKGDYILMEEYTFSSALETALPHGIKAVGVKMDEEGLLPESLDEILTNWDEKARGARRPHLLYTVPSGQNPTGATQSLERRKAVYKVAQKHDVYIVEDEPYYFLQMQPYTGADGPEVPPPATHEDFLKALIPSFLSLDVDGRVLRFESFSKVIAPGSRVGWIVASEQVVERFVRHFETSTQNPSGISQIVLFKLLEEQWGHGGYLDWLIDLRMQYTKRRNAMLHACEQYLPKEIASWIAPAAGMFHWVEVDWRKHPGLTTEASHSDIEESIFQAAIDRGVLVSRGSWFKADRSAAEERMFFRSTFAAAPADKITEAIKRFGDALRAEFGL